MTRCVMPRRYRLARIDELGSADGLSMALMVLGSDDGMALAGQLDLAALFIVRNDTGRFRERTTPRFDTLTKQ